MSVNNGSSEDAVFELAWPPVVMSNDSHTCVNVSVEYDNFHRSKLYMYMYLRFMIVYPLLNLLLHAFSLAIFAQMRSKSVLVRLLVALSLAEVVFQASTAGLHLAIYLMETGRLRFPSSLEAARAAAFLLPLLFVVVTAAHVARNWAVLLVAAMRFEFVCRHAWKRFLFRRRAVAGKVAAVWLLALLVAAPRFLEMTVWLCERERRVAYMDSNLLATPHYLHGYTGGVLAAVQNVGPVAAVWALSACLLHVLWRQRRIRRSLRGGRRSEGGGSLESRSTDLLVVLLCVTYAVCELPGCLKMVSRMDRGLQELAAAMNVLTCVDSTLGFFIYLVTNPEFRATLLRCCCCRAVAGWMNVASRRLTWTERQSTFERSRGQQEAGGDARLQRPLICVTAAPSGLEMTAVGEVGGGCDGDRTCDSCV